MCSSEFMFVFFKQKTAYEMRISDWSSDVCSSDLPTTDPPAAHRQPAGEMREERAKEGLCSWQCQPCLAQKRNSITSAQMSRVQSMRGRCGALVFVLQPTLLEPLAPGLLVHPVPHAQFSESSNFLKYATAHHDNKVSNYLRNPDTHIKQK